MEALRKIIFIIASQSPLVGGLYLNWQQVVQRPLLASLLSGLYELAILLITFWKKVWGELEKDAIKATADWVRAAISNFRPGFRRRYNKAIIREYGVFNVRGLGLINTFTLSLDQVFVDLRIAPSTNPQRAGLDPIAVRNFRGNRPVWDFLRLSGNPKGVSVALAIIGPPGCGKTTLMQHVALTFASNRQRKYRLRAHRPLLLFLRNHADVIDANPSISLGDLAQEYLAKQFVTLKPPVDWFERQLQHGKCLVLLDGLDEVADIRKRELMSSWVDRQTKNYPKCRFIISSRPQGYLSAPLERAHVVEVQPFTTSQVRHFVSNWYRANEIVASGHKDNDEVRYRAQRDADDLLARLKKLPALSALTVNPLLLTMVAMVHRYHGALPGSRVELYDEICEVLLGRWRQSRGIKDRLTAAQKRAILQPLAAEMMKLKIREISKIEAAKIIAPFLNSVGIQEKEAENTLTDFQSGSGLLLEREVGQWSFAHLTFQEYLTAAHWLEDGNKTPPWHSLVGDSWWHETVWLFASQGDATNIVQACLDVGTLSALILAADCADEAHKLNPLVREEINVRLIKGLESDEPALRRFAAEIQLTRRLKSLQRIDDSNEIDLSYVTCAEYQLFLDDLRTQGKYHQPDHWISYNFVKGKAQEPISGIRFEDAYEFCKWLNEKHRGHRQYRLLTPSEVSQWPSETLHFATWCYEGKIASLIPEMYRNEFQALADLLQSKMPLPALGISYLNRSLDSALSRAQDFNRALALACNMPRDLAGDLVNEIHLDLDINDLQAFTYQRERALNRAQELAQFCIIFPTLHTIPQSDLLDIQYLAEIMKDISDSTVLRVCRLLSHILKISDAPDSTAMRHAIQNYLACMLECTYAGCEIEEKELSMRQRDRISFIDFLAWLFTNGFVDFLGWLYRKANPPPLAAEMIPGGIITYDLYIESTPYEKPRSKITWNPNLVKTKVLQEYWRLQIKAARATGNFPAWESIRIARSEENIRPSSIFAFENMLRYRKEVNEN